MSDKITETGIIIKTIDEKAFISVRETGACNDCKAKSLCLPSANSTKQILAKNDLKAECGDEVGFEEIGSIVLKLSFMQFGVPLIGLIIGIFLSSLIDTSKISIPKELIMFISGIILMLFGGLITWIWSNKKAQEKICFFEVTAILKKGKI